MSKVLKNQNFYHLACIQSVSLGIPVIIVGKRISELYGNGVAICSILIGNLILWLIAIAIISMVYTENTNAIENIKGYIGKIAGILFAIILTAAFLNWYVLQINNSVTALYTLLKYSKISIDQSSMIRIGAVLGLLSSLIAIGGIRMLKWITSISFPLVVFYHTYVIIISDYSFFDQITWGLSLPGIIMTILALLPGVINLPTFFCHSQSKANSFLALTLMTIFISFFECSTIWMYFSPQSQFVLSSDSAIDITSYTILTIIFLIFSPITTNFLNIYLASACYKTFIPKFEGTKGYAIMGLLGTAMYTFIQISSPLRFLEKFLDCYIAILGMILLIAIISRIFVQHRPKKFEKLVNALSWIAGCIVSTIFVITIPNSESTPLLYGMGAGALFFLLIFFLEEMVWAIKKLKLKHPVIGEDENTQAF